MSIFLAVMACAFLSGAGGARGDTAFVSFANSDSYVEEFSTSGTAGVNTDLGPMPNSMTDTATPNGIAFDTQGNLYVANDGNNTITRFGPSGNYLGVYASGLSQPAGIACDRSGNLYVVSGNSLLKIAPGGTSTTVLASGFSSPQGVAVGPNGNIYVSDQGSNSVKEVTPGGVVSTFYQDGSYTIVNQVEGLAFDASGNLYVASSKTNSIEEITPAGVASVFANNPSPASDPNDPGNPSNPEGLFNPVGLAFDSSGDLYVANYHHTTVAGESDNYYGTSYIDEFSPTGTLINAFAGNPALAGADPNLRQADYIAFQPTSIATLADSLTVSSTAALNSSGVTGGPFTPAGESIVLADSGSGPLAWSASTAQSWLTLSATGGTLAASGSTTVTATINSSANALAAGTYYDTFVFTDLGTGYTATENVTLVISTPPVLPPAPILSSPLTEIAYSGTTFSYQITANNNPTSYGASGLPSWLAFSSTTGLLSGTAGPTGTSIVNISASNAGGTASANLVITVAPPGTWGLLAQTPPNLVTVSSTNRNNVFYVGNPITLRLTNPSAAVSYEIRDYWGNIVEQGPAAEFIYPQVTQPGWYKIYIKGAGYQAPWGCYVGVSTFVIWRNDPNFPALPPANTWGGAGFDDGVIRGIAAIGVDRHQVDDTDVPDSISDVGEAAAVDEQYYITPGDPARPRKLLASFAGGTTNLAAVTQIVTALKGSIKYWEPLNEPNFATDPTDFVNNQLIPFYNTIKGIDPTLKVLGPEIVSIGPPLQSWVQGFIAAGGLNYIDGFSFHAYNNTNGDLWLTRQTMNYMDSILASHPNLERWQTEQGYDSALYGMFQPRLQGRWTMLQMMVFEQHHLPKEQNNLWYDKNAGFWDAPSWWENADGCLNAGAALMRVWSEELYGTTFSRAYDFGCPGNKLYVGDLFQGTGKQVAAFITAGSPLETIQLTDTGDASVNIVSPFGVERSLPVQSGSFALPISEAPTYVEFSGTLGVAPVNSGTDIALMPGTTATASGDGLYPPDPSVPNSPSKIINGILENWYWTQTPETHPWMDDTPQFPAWVQVNFPSPQTINNVVIYAGAPWQLDGTLLNYDLQYLNNGQWVTLASVDEPTKTFQAYMATNESKVDSFFSDRWVFQHTFPAVTTQSIRLWVRDATWGGLPTQLAAESGGFSGPHHICLREIEVYNNANLNVTPNQPPVATGTSAVTTVETPVTVNVLNCASDPDNGPEPLYIQSVGKANDGVVSISGTQVVYNPSPGFSGTDAFTYTVSDGLATATATVNVTVNPVVRQYAPMSGLIGLVGQYYGNQNLTDPLFTRADGYVDFNWGFSPPAPGMNATNYSVVWSGTVQAGYSENYTFYTYTSDGAMLWVNGEQLVSDWVAQPATLESWSIPLKAGQQYPIVMEYFNNTADSTAVLSWASASQPMEVIPPFPAEPPLNSGGLSNVAGQYYGTTNFTDLLDTRVENAIDFNWSSAAPFPNMSRTNFSVKWTGQIIPQYSQTYTFYTTSDDGVRLYINGTLVINDWNSHGSTVDTATLPMVSGSAYNMEMDYYQLTGSAIAELQWSSPSQTLEVIPELPEQAWTQANFTAAQLADPGLSGPTGSVAADGMPNLLKYAFDINPQSSEGNGGPTMSFYTAAGHDYMALIYRRNIEATDLTYDVQVNTTLDPSTWTTTTAVETILGQDATTGDLFVRRSVDVTGMPVEFMRLNVW